MTTPQTATGGVQWWAISITGGTPGLGSWKVVSGTAAAIKAQYDGAAFGPFPTQAAAQAYANKGGPGPAIPGTYSSIVPNPLSFLAALGWIQEIGHWLGVFITAITDLHTWISIGWLSLGFWMLVIGILLWLRIPQRAAKAAKEAGEAAGAAAVVAA